jgi:transcriptional regulator
MYIPNAFRIEELPAIHELMRRHSFATLVSVTEGAPFASHIPLLLDPSCGAYGTLRGHVARGNPQWRHFDSGAELLAIFHGPHAYVSPSWYETELSVPTWNYTTVHAYGSARVTEDREQVLTLLRDLVDEYESGFAEPWPMPLPEEFVDKLLLGIVAFEIEITRIEGKAKLSQNRPAGDRRGARGALAGSPDAAAREIAALMEALG